ncbi:hypothetical protein [Actinopolymorpha rutila]|uniref:hypothetical protein n=1 Tax=Actinopolymorpha rutila TaxID=446787 RepID=UPI001EE30598|nr:hypothetical protein [Actinopolymorpha rutila]
MSLRTGTVNTTAVPVRLGWNATDNAALKNVHLTAPTALTFGAHHHVLEPHRRVRHRHHLRHARLRLRRQLGLEFHQCHNR